MIFYVAGKMTGLENKGREHFFAAEEKLNSLGHIVINPAKLPDGLSNQAYMSIGFSMIDSSDAIYLLDNYEDSPGAALEIQYATYTGKEIFKEGINDSDIPFSKN